MSDRRDILFLAYEGAQLLDVTGPLQMFAGANEHQGRAIYQVRIAAGDGGPFGTSAGVRLVADLGLADVTDAVLARTDTIVVAGGDAGLRPALKDGAIVDIARRAAGVTPRIASVCTGAFVLAAAGLLDGRRAATHWAAIRRMRRFRPEVDVDPDAIHVRDGDVWTSAGVTAGIDLALAMIEADHDRDLALDVARQHVVFRVRPGGQSQFSAALESDGAEGPLANLARSIVEEPAEDWTIDRLAETAAMSPRTLARRFRKSLGASPAAFVERARIDFARRALLETDDQIQTIAEAAGFGGLRRMDRAFSRALGVAPTDFRARFRAPPT